MQYGIEEKKTDKPKNQTLAIKIEAIQLVLIFLMAIQLFYPNIHKGYAVAYYDGASTLLLESNSPKPFFLADVTVTGTVSDQNGEPIPGATVSLPGTTIGTATDLDGK